MTNIAVVVPTIRPDLLEEKFIPAWQRLFNLHEVAFVVVEDGEEPVLTYNGVDNSVEDIMGMDSDLIYNFNDGVRNLGFAYVAKNLPDVEYIITLDDDLIPKFDTIDQHIKALRQHVPIRWLSTADEYMRGFPYEIREEAEVVLSHGVWYGVPDYDAPTQLVKGNPDVGFYRGPVPRGTYYPMCFLPGTEVVMGNGEMRKIEDIVVGDLVTSGNGETRRVLRKIKRSSEGKHLRVSLRSGVDLFSTPDHEFLTAAGWKRCGDLSPDDRLRLPKLAFSGQSPLSNEDMYILGLFIAEGSFSKNKNMANSHKVNGVTFSLAANEQDTFGRRVEDYFRGKYNKVPAKYVVGNSVRYEIYGVEIAKYFYELVGEYAWGKTIPEEVLRSRNIQKLLQGLFDGDGYIGSNRGRPIVSYHTISKGLAEQVRLLVTGLGFYCGLTEYSARNRKYPQYKVTLYGENAASFAKEILDSKMEWEQQKKKTSHIYKSVPDFVEVGVGSVEKIEYTGDVYDLTVDTDSTYLAEGFVVHNCGMNVAFKRKMLPYMYWAPMGKKVGLDRFADIWLGIVSKRIIDQKGWAVVTGYASVKHERASNVYKNLVKEARGIGLNEGFWKGEEDDPYFELYKKQRERWEVLIKKWLKH